MKVKISDLKKILFVRIGLNQDHALQLADLVENGVELSPIKITKDGVVVDGRHRIEAHELCQKTEIEAEIVEVVGGEAGLLAAGFKYNFGGSLPPTTADTEHTIQLLLDCGASKKAVADMLGLPVSLTRKYIAQIESKIKRQKLQRAVTAVTEGGLTAAQAAEKHGVEPESLKETLSGHRKKAKREGIEEIQRSLTTTHKSLSQKNAALIRDLLIKFEDGDVTAKQVREVLVHIEGLQKRSASSVADWRKRFEAKLGGGKGSKEVKKA